MKVEIVYQEQPLDGVLEACAKGFKPLKRGSRILRKEWFVDMVKGVVVFRLTIQSGGKSK